MTHVYDLRKTSVAGTVRGPEEYRLVRSVFFVGFMGAGKTSVARKLARLAGVAAIDMDTYIERREDRRVRDIFAQEGEEGFRQIETQVLRELVAAEPALVSCGGGVVVRRENRAILKEDGFVICLEVTADEAAARIGDLSTRPLFSDLQRAREIVEARLPLYREVADEVIDTTSRSSASIAHEALRLLQERGVLEVAQSGGKEQLEDRNRHGKEDSGRSSR